MARLARRYRMALGEREKRAVEAATQRHLADPSVLRDTIVVTRLAQVLRLLLAGSILLMVERGDSLPGPLQGAFWIGLLALVIGMLMVPVLLVQAVGFGAASVRSAYAVTVFTLTAPLVTVLGREGSGYPLRWLAFGLFLVGFHFDLLGS